MNCCHAHQTVIFASKNGNKLLAETLTHDQGRHLGGAVKWNFLHSSKNKTAKNENRIFRSFTPGPTGRAYSTPLDPLAVGRGLAQALLPLPKNLNPSPLSALLVSDFSFSDLVSHSRLARLPPPSHCPLTGMTPLSMTRLVGLEPAKL